MTRPPLDWWRPVPCGHPADPVAWTSGAGIHICHCGWTLTEDDTLGSGWQQMGAPGPIAPCAKCGCYVAIPIEDISERERNEWTATVAYCPGCPPDVCDCNQDDEFDEDGVRLADSNQRSRRTA